MLSLLRWCIVAEYPINVVIYHEKIIGLSLAQLGVRQGWGHRIDYQSLYESDYQVRWVEF